MAAHYFSGHDHCEGHINEGTGVEYIVTGAGMECCYAAPNLPKVPKGSVKFFTAGHGGSAYQARSPPIWIPRDLLLRLPRAIPLDPPSAVRRPTGACRDLPLSPKKLDLP